MRRAGLAAALTMMVLLAGATSASAATSAFWGPVTPYANPSDQISGIVSLSCSSRGNCVGVGSGEVSSSSSTDAYHGLIAVEAGGVWSAPVTVATPPATPASSTPVDLQLTAVSCQSATSCVAVGDYENSANGEVPVVVPFTVSGATATPGAAVSPAPPTTPDAAYATNSASSDAIFSGVSCTASSCTAVGSYDSAAGDTLPMSAVGSGASWTTSEDTLPTGVPVSQGGLLTAVSCPPTGSCEAVGSYQDSGGKSNPWAIQLSGGTATGVKVTFPGDFVPGTPGSSIFPGITYEALSSISCPASGVCTAGGGYPTGSSSAVSAVAVPISAGVPGTAVKVAGTNSGGGIPGLDVTAITGIWCSDATDCVADGLGEPVAYPEAVVASESAGTWSTLSGLANQTTAIETISGGIACADLQDCTVAALNVTSASSSEAFTPGFAVSAPTLTSATTSLPVATVGKPYSATLQTTGGINKPSWAITIGGLPAGLSLNAATGVISGTPTTAGQDGFILTGTDSGPPAQTVTSSLSITVAAATPVPTVTVAYDATSGSKATLVLTCSGAPCTGTVGLTATEHLKGTTPTAVSAAAGKHKKKKTGGKAKTKTITLASGRYSITAGGSQTITLTLNGSAAKLLKKLHKLTGTFSLTPTGATKPAVINTIKFTAAPKAKKPKK